MRAAAIYLPTSASCSANEPNDSPFQAPLRHNESYFVDTFDNTYDIDVVRVQLTTAEPVAISLTFTDKSYNGQVSLKIYHKSDLNGNPVNQWLVNGTINVPASAVAWNNSTATGEFYAYAEYIGGDMLNREYTFSFTPLSKMQKPEYITTAKNNGITGLEYGTVNEASGGYLHWVMGTFRLRADFAQYASHITMTETGDYPAIPFRIELIGQDRNGNFDEDNNAFFSVAVQNDKYGYTTVGALLPGSYGHDGYLSGTYYNYPYDFNIVAFWFLAYNDSIKNFEWRTFPQTDVYVTFYLFINAGV